MLYITLLFAALLGAQDFEHLQIEPIPGDFAGGEGSVWSREGFLLFSDYDVNRIYKYVPGKSPEVFREGSNGANGNTMDRQGRLYTCEYRSRRVTRTDRKGRIEALAERFEGKRFNAPNDIVVRRRCTLDACATNYSTIGCLDTIFAFITSRKSPWSTTLSRSGAETSDPRHLSGVVGA